MFEEIPGPIRRAVEGGNAILFLGSGASYDALIDNNPTRIYAATLKDKLSDEFLGGLHKKRSLITVADYARNEASLSKVQAFVRVVFLPLSPAEFHLKIPTFRWRAIVSTNYDLIVERAYNGCQNQMQTLMPVTKDGDQLERALAGQNTLPYLKLHGCITNYTDTQVPIVLDSQEYAEFKQGRENLVRTFAEWAAQSPIIFCGYSLGDENIKQILFDIGDASQSRDQYLYVNLEFDDIERRYWMGRRINPYAANFDGFLTALDSAISPQNRKLASLFRRDDLSISKWIPSHVPPSLALIQYLSDELMHITPEEPVGPASEARDFYSGLDTSFSPIYADLDIRRSLTDDVINAAVIDTLESTLPKVFIIQGYAGCGKSVLAKRVAIETSRLLDKPLVVWLKEGSILRTELLLELQGLVGSRIYLFVDDAIEYQDSLPKFIETIFQKNIKFTVLTCGRTNELNIYAHALQKRCAATFELHDLDEREVPFLLERLSIHKILGPLDQYSDNERRLFVDKLYNQQLLVALHEITFGDSFEEILVSEFEKLSPRESQQIYLDICTLHQASVGVRAGLLSRVSGLPIETLNKMLIGPLARVVRTNFETRYRDYTYKSRHPEIAKMVFSLAISEPAQRAYQLIRILGKIDLNYSSDRKAFFELIRGKRLADLFEEKALAISVFDAAEQTGAPPAFVLHQRAILEINHRAGNLDQASEYVKQAEIVNRAAGFRDSSTQHTKANLLRKKALYATSRVERDRYRADARSILKPQLATKENSYPEHLLGQILLDELKDFFAQSRQEMANDGASDIRDQSIMRVTSELSSLVDGYLQKHADDTAMTLLRNDFLKSLGQQPKALHTLERFYKKNPDNASISRVFGEALVAGPDLSRGIDVLRGAVLVSPNDKPTSLALAKALIRQDEFHHAESILSFLRRSFSDGDSHYEARYLFARCNVLYGDLNRGNDEFKSLKSAFVEDKDRIAFPVCNLDGHPKRYRGTVISRPAGYGFMKCADLRFNTFFGRRNLTATEWALILNGTEIEFSLYFSYRGAVGSDLKVLSLYGN